MSGQIQQTGSLTNTDVDLMDVLDLLKKKIKLELNAHHVGIVQSFNAQKQLAAVQIVYTKTFFKLNESTGSFSPVQVNYPVLVDCPIVALGGGPSSLTFPITKGDECLLLINDRDIDNWFQTGQVGGPVKSSRLHSVSDAFALVGIRSSPKSLASYDAVRAVLQNGSTVVGVGPSLVRIANSSTTLNTQLQALCTQLNNLVTAIAAITVTCTAPGSSSGTPLNATAINQVGTQLSSIATKLGGLLE